MQSVSIVLAAFSIDKRLFGVLFDKFYRLRDRQSNLAAKVGGKNNNTANFAKKVQLLLDK